MSNSEWPKKILDILVDCSVPNAPSDITQPLFESLSLCLHMTLFTNVQVWTLFGNMHFSEKIQIRLISNKFRTQNTKPNELRMHFQIPNKFRMDFECPINSLISAMRLLKWWNFIIWCLYNEGRCVKLSKISKIIIIKFLLKLLV